MFEFIAMIAMAVIGASAFYAFTLDDAELLEAAGVQI